VSLHNCSKEIAQWEPAAALRLPVEKLEAEQAKLIW